MLIGVATNTTITNCTVQSSFLKVDPTATQVYAGGIVGCGTGINMIGCVNYGFPNPKQSIVYGGGRVGGLAAACYQCNIAKTFFKLVRSFF